MAEGLGFEPRLTGPEPVVLPLDDPSAFCKRILYLIIFRASRGICKKEDQKLRRSGDQRIKGLQNKKLLTNDKFEPRKIALMLNKNKTFQLYFPLKTAWQWFAHIPHRDFQRQPGLCIRRRGWIPASIASRMPPALNLWLCFWIRQYIAVFSRLQQDWNKPIEKPFLSSKFLSPSALLRFLSSYPLIFSLSSFDL